MKKILLTLVSLSAFIFADSATLSICGYTDDGATAGTASFNVCYATDFDMAGFQLSFSELSGAADITITGASGGDAQTAGFTVSSSSATVLGFSFSGATTSSTNGQDALLTVVSVSYTGEGITEVGFGSASTLTSSNTSIPVSLDLYSQSWDAGLLDSGLPGEYKLSSAYPNPFNPTTTIDYNVEIAGNVSLVVYDLMGREIKTLVNDFRAPRTGGYKVMWDGTNNDGSLVASGMYMYRMISNDFTKTYRLTLMK